MIKRLSLLMIFLISLTVINAWNFEGGDTYTITGNLTEFLELTDTPNTYTGEGGNCVLVNVGETGLEFGACSESTGDITSVLGDSYITNGSSSGLVQLKFNETRLNNTIDLRASGSENASWNQSHANTLYAGIQWGYNMTTATYNLYNSAWNSTYNSTYAGAVSNASYLSTYNSTYAYLISQNCGTGQVVNGTNSTGGFICTTVAGSGDITDVLGDIWIINGSSSGLVQLLFNTSQLSSYGNNLGWNSTYNSTYAGSVSNASYLSTYNSTYDAKVSFVNTNISYINNTNIYTANQNMSNKNVTNVQCIVFNSGGKICSS